MHTYYKLFICGFNYTCRNDYRGTSEKYNLAQNTMLSGEAMSSRHTGGTDTTLRSSLIKNIVLCRLFFFFNRLGIWERGTDIEP